ncbi:MAG TPA: GNAT family N-acetyltransferase [Prolixibacteraceae bacterium]|nr:GNAT family N-acetyltransferase [Prolixibacteraceae bacterium]
MIETLRLQIRPLSVAQLKKYACSPDDLAGEMDVISSEMPMAEEVRDAILIDLLPYVADHEKDPMFYTFWIIIEKDRKAVIGGFCFHGEPDENGEVEIGYGIDEPFQNQGYMSETIAGFIHWLAENPTVKTVKAETGADNLPSVRVLERNGFKLFQLVGNNLILKLEL